MSPTVRTSAEHHRRRNKYIIHFLIALAVVGPVGRATAGWKKKSLTRVAARYIIHTHTPTRRRRVTLIGHGCLGATGAWTRCPPRTALPPYRRAGPRKSLYTTVWRHRRRSSGIMKCEPPVREIVIAFSASPPARRRRQRFPFARFARRRKTSCLSPPATQPQPTPHAHAKGYSSLTATTTTTTLPLPHFMRYILYIVYSCSRRRRRVIISRPPFLTPSQHIYIYI